MIRLLRHDERGFTLTELMLASALGAVAAALMAAALVSFTRTEVRSADQTVKLAGARSAFEQLENDLRYATFVSWCQPTGYCLEVGTTGLASAVSTAKYVVTSGAMTRSTYLPSSSSWSDPAPMIGGLDTTSAVFVCDTTTTFLRVNVSLKIVAANESLAPYEFQSSVRPRNFPSTSACPT